AKESANSIDYRVAMDAGPKGKRGEEAAMAVGWRGAAGKSGIPTAFVVNRGGVSAWIGHPAELAKPLADVVANRWDVKAEAQRQKEERVRERKLRAVAEKIRKTQEDGDTKAVVAIIDAAIRDDAKMEALLS